MTSINHDPVLRPWQPGDIDDLIFHGNNPRVAAFMTDQFPHPYTTEAAEQFINKTMQYNPAQVFAITIDNKAIGGIGIYPQTDISRMNAEIGYWLGETFWNKGIITKCIPKIVEYGFSTFDIDRIFARPFGTNIASQKALEKCGFIFEGRFKNTWIKNNERFDELIYAIRKVN